MNECVRTRYIYSFPPPPPPPPTAVLCISDNRRHHFMLRSSTSPTFHILYRRILRSINRLEKEVKSSNNNNVGEIDSLVNYYKDWSLQHIINDGTRSLTNEKMASMFLIDGEKKRRWVLNKYNLTDSEPSILPDWENYEKLNFGVGGDTDDDRNTLDDEQKLLLRKKDDELFDF